MYVKKVPCPCGMGNISQTVYGDDWNRVEYAPVQIECELCSQKYKVEEEHHSSIKPHHGDWTIYYLTPVDYPAYDGISEIGVYGPKSYDSDFSKYLIENYSFSDLTAAKSEYTKKASSSKVTGVARKICASYRRRFKTTKTALIMEQIEKAIALYQKYEGNYDQRTAISQQESNERRAYTEEKRKHQIMIDL